MALGEKKSFTERKSIFFSPRGMSVTQKITLTDIGGALLYAPLTPMYVPIHRNPKYDRWLYESV